MFKRFTERARQVVVLAQDEARALKHNYIGTEHLLLGLFREEEGVAASVLESLDITVEEVRAEVARIIGQGDEVATGQIPFTPRAKKVLELALREALLLGHQDIGTEHILLGLVRENEGVAARILLDFDADAETVRNEVVAVLRGRPSEPSERPLYVPKSPPVAPEFIEELERIRREKHAAIEAGQFEEAARQRGRERVLLRKASELQAAWDAREELGRPTTSHTPAGVEARAREAEAGRSRSKLRQRVAVPVWVLLAAAAAPLLALAVLLGRLTRTRRAPRRGLLLRPTRPSRSRWRR
jgi:ATP-dependent Clp protease ATP-binding subunit ClpA